MGGRGGEARERDRLEERKESRQTGYERKEAEIHSYAPFAAILESIVRGLALSSTKGKSPMEVV